MQQRTCTVCGETKDINKFFRAINRKDSYHSACKGCHTEQVRRWRKANGEKWKKITHEYAKKTWWKYREAVSKWRIKNKDAVKKRARERVIEVKMKVYSHYSQGVPRCKCCGETEVKFLSVDHINNDGAKHRRTMRRGKKGGGTGSGTQLYYWIIRNGFPKVFQILCLNCNFGKRFNGICPHKYVNSNSK